VRPVTTQIRSYLTDPCGTDGYCGNLLA
jgi:hypothetical protein